MEEEVTKEGMEKEVTEEGMEEEVTMREAVVIKVI